ncbi:hypothetical protein [uncultured Paraglaciecola sp.]|uniref:hypothetical protein n=1 Tax=uncultured Paraglaciecola sp. TaxID=1765024 RepID=UPI00259771EF|nr:hypothetical protein [uncultured Paraglaciecola sp.]
MDKIEFVAFCESQLKQVFNLTKQGKPDTKQKHRVEGVLLAGEMLGVLDRVECSELMEKAHLEVFGETLAVRTERKQSQAKLKALSPDDYFDIPAIERRR